MTSPRVVYIVGANRSGSTILSAMLDAQAGFFAVGELNALLTDDDGQPRRCSCARLLGDCPFWGPVLESWKDDLTPGDPDEYQRRIDRFERFRSLPALAWNSLRPGDSFRTYQRWTQSLLRHIAEQASANTVVDASKTPVRALSLLEAGAVRVALVHLIRDPRAVAWSKRKLLRWKTLPSWISSPLGVVVRVSIDWWLANLTAEWVARRYPRTPYIRIRYEDLMDEPVRVLHSLETSLALDLAGIVERVGKREAFPYRHVMAGNVARHQPGRSLVKDDQWRDAAPAWIRGVVWAMCWPLARKYGYNR